ncbi:hypothetical protein GCM10010840_16340 [Deinococcus aerolatus]|uniref:DUF302 domain-containing protein n=1 Tax=Deinococcus aerolatus TaxID=522487 RepID=A0ABQ2G7C7_9DEIO|nr:DUF302 domain-containing protein [Deinococcus aerolatus]GGL79221.1 hypothetical protein GCM10010840_16340 [Deinococcus aerolatus]
MTEFALKRTFEADVDAVLERLKTALSAEGLGVLYTLEFSDIIADKTGHQLAARVVGLGVCSPDLARQALELDPSVAALLPCGAFVSGMQTGTEVGFLDPVLALGLTENEALGPLGVQARSMLQRVLDGI